MALHKLSAANMHQYSEHAAGAKAHFQVAEQLGRSGNFHEAATMHYNQAVKDRNSARDTVKSSPVSSPGWSHDNSATYHAHKSMYDNRANN